MTEETSLPIYVNGRFAAQNLSGVQRFALEMFAALKRLSPHRVRLITPKSATLEGAEAVGRSRGQLWEQVELPIFAGKGFIINLGNTAPLLAPRQVVVIHDAGVFSAPEAYSLRFRLWYKFMQRMLVRRGVPIITVSEFSRREIIQHLRAAPIAVHVISEGTDHMNRIKSDTYTLARHGLTAARYVLVVGTLAKHKNLSALRLLGGRLEGEGIKLVITGSFGSAVFSSGVAGLPQPGCYVGRVSDAELKSLYESAVCLVFPSLYEGFGLPAVEAMACGCPVIASDIPALRETCGNAAIYCDPASPEDITAKVLTVVRNELLQTRLRHAGWERAQYLTWERAASALFSIVHEVGIRP